VPDLREETAMTVVDIPFRFPLTAEEFEQLPPIEGVRVELSEGTLEMAAAAQRAWHSLVKERIAPLLRKDGRKALMDTDVVLAPRTVREPDVTRFRAGYQLDLNRAQFPATAVDLVVEIVSPESERRDRVVKPQEYAAAGILEMWIVERLPGDPEDALVTSYRLTPGKTYEAVRQVALPKLESEAHS
jgi:Uma2 family endonuclease